MNTKITLTNPTDDELSAAVAEHVDGWRYIGLASTVGCDPRMWAKGTPWQADYVTMRQDQFNYATSADAVLPLLERAYRKSSVADHSFCVEMTWLPSHQRNCSGYEWAYCVQIFPSHEGIKCGTANTLARAACIALLRANGVEVVT